MEIINNMKVIEKFSKRMPNGKLKYYARMICHCGKVFETRYDKKSLSCGCRRAEINRTRALGRYGNRTYEERCFKARMSIARSMFKQNNYGEKDISFEDFLRLSQDNCHYCGSGPTGYAHPGKTQDGTVKLKSRNTTNPDKYKVPVSAHNLGEEAAFIYNGLDRIDSSGIHEKSNTVVCCKTCNYMKRHMPVDDFLTHIKRIYECIQLKK